MKSTQRPGRVPNVMSTGDRQLDDILGGGIPEGSTTILAGPPGSGKTALATKMVFTQAQRGVPVVYVMTLGEPSVRLLHYVEQFSFFDADLADRWVEFMDVGSQLLRSPDDALAAISDRVRSRGAALVVIDSFRAFHDLLNTRAEARSFVYRLTVSLESMGATTLLLGTYSRQELDTLPEFAVADGILRFDSEHNGLATTRQLEVLKLRGSAFSSGVHSFDITSSGLVVFPRVQAPTAASTEAAAQREPTGLPGLDEMFGGGLWARSTTLVQGSTGTGKTMLSLAFLLEGARRGEPGIYFGMDETPAQIREVARSVGWDLADLEARGLLFLHYSSPVELVPDRYLLEVREAVRGRGARRVVVDSLSAMETGVDSQRRFRELVYSLGKHMRAAEVTLLMAMETPETVGASQLTGHAVASIADNVILLRYIEFGGQLRKAITVLKARGTGHKTEFRSYAVGTGGPQIGESLADLRGVVTGLPVRAAEAYGAPEPPVVRKARTPHPAVNAED